MPVLFCLLRLFYFARKNKMISQKLISFPDANGQQCVLFAAVVSWAITHPSIFIIPPTSMRFPDTELSPEHTATTVLHCGDAPLGRSPSPFSKLCARSSAFIWSDQSTLQSVESA